MMRMIPKSGYRFFGQDHAPTKKVLSGNWGQFPGKIVLEKKTGNG
jgi:hypothetical protein